MSNPVHWMLDLGMDSAALMGTLVETKFEETVSKSLDLLDSQSDEPLDLE